MLTYIILNISRTRFPSFTLVKPNSFPRTCVQSVFLGFVADETHWNNSQRIYLGPVSLVVVTRVVHEKKEGRRGGKNWHPRRFTRFSTLEEVWMVFEFRAPLKDDRTSIVLTFTKEHCARFETRCRSHCCRRIFKNVTIVDVFGREKLNTPPPPPENVYFHFKVHFRILLPVVSFDIRRYTKRR